MGRRRVEIKRIEDKSSRQVSFCKRRNGLMEKARQLSVLCESSVALVIVSSTGKVYSSSSGDSMAEILKRYETLQANDPTAMEHEENIRNYISHEEVLEIVQSKLEEVNAENISLDALTSLEEQFKAALSITRAKKTELMNELVRTLQEKEKLLREQNQVLASQLTKETEYERAMLSENSCGNNPPETLSLLK